MGKHSYTCLIGAAGGGGGGCNEGGWPTDECGMEEGAFSVSGIKRDEGWENRCVSGVSSVTVIVKARLDVLIRKVGGQYFIY